MFCTMRMVFSISSFSCIAPSFNSSVSLPLGLLTDQHSNNAATHHGRVFGHLIEAEYADLSFTSAVDDRTARVRTARRSNE